VAKRAPEKPAVAQPQAAAVETPALEREAIRAGAVAWAAKRVKEGKVDKIRFPR
jgi:hypothetical protein